MSNSEELLRESLVKYAIPEHMHDAAVLYVLHRRPCGDFLNAVVTNDLHEAFSRADEDNAAAMRQWVKWFHNEAPSQCWGSHDKVREWLKAGIAERERQRELEAR